MSRTRDWSSCLGSTSLHTLLEPFSRRTASIGSRCPALAATSPPTIKKCLDTPTLGAFDAAFVLLAQRPALAEEKQIEGRVDEECAGVENMERSPLIVAARCGLVGIAWLIARHCTPEGGGLNQQDTMGFSALRYAILSKNVDMCNCLLSFPALDLEVPDARGDSALFQSVTANAPVICRLLLARHANVAFTNRGQTALDLAEALGYEECAAALREFGAPQGFGRTRGEDAEWSDGDDGLGESGSDPDPELLEALRESRRFAAAGGKVAPSCVSDGEMEFQSDDEDEQGRDRKRQRRRWDSGGLFIKTRGGPARSWQG